MKHELLYLALLGVLLCCCGCFTGTLTETSLVHDGIRREFSIYVPLKYDGKSPVPLLLNLHGYSSNASEQMAYGDFRAISDTANFILVHPQGTKYRDTTHWNTGGWTPGSTVDDLGFLNAVIDHMVKNYRIDPKRIYSAGMSNGGEMSYHLACKFGRRIAAIASVAGCMTPETFASCTPGRPIPVLHIHGTGDSVVPYDGDKTATAVMEGLNYWVNVGECGSVPKVSMVPNKNMADKSTVEHYVFAGERASVEHFKVLGGDHTWPGAAFNIGITNQDIDASEEIWKFFNRYDLDGLRK